MKKLQSTLYLFGLGYSARRLAKRLQGEDWSLFASTRRQDQAEDLKSNSIGPVPLNGGPINPPVGSQLLISAPPNEEGCPALAAWGERAAHFSTITYLSTTGVYGDLAGGWAFETTPVRPRSARAQRRVDAEIAWRSLAEKAGAVFRTVRLPGIYGPGRSPFDRLQAGTARRIVKPGQVFSRIHVDDLVDGLYRLIQRPDLGGVFHLCDDHPARPDVVIAYGAELLGLPEPPAIPFERAELSPMARSFYAECKRVSNARAKAALGWRPVYKDYKAGLADVLERQMS